MDRNRVISKLKGISVRPDGRRTTYSVADELGRGGNGAAFVVKGRGKELVAKFYVPPDTRDLDNTAYKRFVREIELASRLTHPYVIRAEGTGILTLGSFSIPYYLMPRATATLRSIVPPSYSRKSIVDALRTFVRLCLGVSYLHASGITHRDLKPENVLLFRGGIPRVSDFGIAQVAPGFVEWSRLTVPKDQLLNRDYYAPEQRFGDATQVDNRADIYALGCMLYEMITGMPAVRPSMPKLASVDRGLSPLQGIFDRMTAHDPKDRFAHIAFVIDEVTYALPAIGREFNQPYSDAAVNERLSKSLTNFNATARRNAFQIASKHPDEALPVLHEHLGHRRVDVIVAACEILGELRDQASLPYLVATLYPRRGTRKLTFPTGQAGAQAIRAYDDASRIRAIELIGDIVQASDIKVIVDGLRSAVIFDRLLALFQSGRIFRDHGQPGMSLLLQIDREKAWEMIKDSVIRGRDVYPWTIRRELMPYMSPEQQMEALSPLVERAGRYDFNDSLEILSESTIKPEEICRLVGALIRRAETVFDKYGPRIEFMNRAKSILVNFAGAKVDEEKMS